MSAHPSEVSGRLPQAPAHPQANEGHALAKAGATAVDMEVRAHADHHASLRLWLRLLSATTRIEDTIRQRLREHFGITLPRFDLMAQLEREPQGLSMGQLSRRMMVTGGNVTSIVDQLEKEQLVQRHAQPGDRRAYAVQLTVAGREAFAAMATAHESWVIELLSPLPALQQEQLHQLLDTLKNGQVSPSIALHHPARTQENP
jgi:DNA-binding MarR family transcriptional regulator